MDGCNENIVCKVHEITYGFGGPIEKNVKSSFIFYCKIPNLCQFLTKSAQIFLVMSDRTDKFRELCVWSASIYGMV